MAVTVASILSRVDATLQDTSNIRWPDTELILWVNDAQREITYIKPDATATVATVTLVAGTKQSIPSAGNRLLDITRNMSAASSGTGGRAIRLVTRDSLDAQSPSWHDPTVTGSAKHTNVVKHYTYEDSNPRTFYVYPGVSGNAYVELTYSANPATVATSDNIGVPDIYSTAIMNYVLYMAYMKEAEFAENSQRAGAHYQLFTSMLAGKGQLDAATSPNLDIRKTPTAVATG
jgi:hypothetical protein